MQLMGVFTEPHLSYASTEDADSRGVLTLKCIPAMIGCPGDGLICAVLGHEQTVFAPNHLPERRYE